MLYIPSNFYWTSLFPIKYVKSSSNLPINKYRPNILQPYFSIRAFSMLPIDGHKEDLVIR